MVYLVLFFFFSTLVAPPFSSLRNQDYPNYNSSYSYFKVKLLGELFSSPLRIET